MQAQQKTSQTSRICREQNTAHLNTEETPANICRTGELVVRQAGEGEQESAVQLSASTETASLELVCWNDEIHWAYRILEHSEDAIDRTYMQDGLVVTDGHFGDQIGIIRETKVKSKKLSGEVTWSSTERAQVIKQDAIAGIRKNVSIDGAVDESSYELEGERDGLLVGSRAECRLAGVNHLSVDHNFHSRNA